MLRFTKLKLTVFASVADPSVETRSTHQLTFMRVSGCARLLDRQAAQLAVWAPRTNCGGLRHHFRDEKNGARAVRPAGQTANWQAGLRDAC